MKLPNPLGLFDMHGNVREWCSDWFGEKLLRVVDPVGPREGLNRVNRGGSFGGLPVHCRSAFRFSNAPSNRGDDLGFRVARSQSVTVTRPVLEKPEPVEKVFKLGETITNSIGMELIELTAGKFTMGSPEGEKDGRNNEAQVRVTLTKPFGLGKFEVTQGQWQEVMGKVFRGKKYDVKNKNFPASEITWDEAKKFCEKLTATEHKNGELPEAESYRLPTEAEWEYACRAGTTTAYSFGNDESKLGEYDWFGGSTRGEEYDHKVGLKKPNPWGLHDMHGNVEEWCSDWYGEGLSGGADPVGPKGGSDRVFRGGSWWDDPGGCRSACRNGIFPSIRVEGLGFRVARSQSAQ